MKKTDSKKSLKDSNAITSWDDVVFDPQQLIREGQQLVAHYRDGVPMKLRKSRVSIKAPNLEPNDILAIRETRKMSRPLFARALNVPVITLRKWESGERKPSGAALRLLELMQKRPELLDELTPRPTRVEQSSC